MSSVLHVESQHTKQNEKKNKMGQKTTPTSLRLLNIQNWRSQWFSKQPFSIAFLNYFMYEFSSFLHNILYSFNILIHSWNLKYSLKKLKIFIIYGKMFQKTRFFFINKKKKIRFYICNSIEYTNYYKKFVVLKRYKEKLKKTIFLLFFLRYLKWLSINLNIQEKSISSNFIKKICLFLSSYLNITEVEIICTDYSRFSKYPRLPSFVQKNFYQECRYLFNVMKLKGFSASFLANFLKKKLEDRGSRKNQARFLKLLRMFLRNNEKWLLHQIYGLKIEVNGRLNGRKRSKKEIIQIGTLPLQTTGIFIDYVDVESYTVYGSFGIKVWIFSEKNQKQIQFSKFFTNYKTL